MIRLSDSPRRRRPHAASTARGLAHLAATLRHLILPRSPQEFSAYCEVLDALAALPEPKRSR